MTAVLLRRLLRLLVVCFGISLITFLLLHLSGDPVAMILPEATEADRAVLRETLGSTGHCSCNMALSSGVRCRGTSVSPSFIAPLPCPWFSSVCPRLSC